MVYLIRLLQWQVAAGIAAAEHFSAVVVKRFVAVLVDYVQGNAYLTLPVEIALTAENDSVVPASKGQATCSTGLAVALAAVPPSRQAL